MREPQMLIELENPSKFARRLVEAAGRLQTLCKSHATEQVERILPEGTRAFVDGLLGPPDGQQVVQGMIPANPRRHRLAGHRPFEPTGRLGPVVVVYRRDEAQHRMPFRKRRIDLERFAGFAADQRHRLVRGQQAVVGELGEVKPERAVRQRKVGVERDGLLEPFPAARQSLRRQLLRLVHRPQVRLVARKAGRVPRLAG